MDEIETNFLGLEISDNGPGDEIKKALGTSIKLLDIYNFMEAVNFKRDPIMTSHFWQIMVEKRCTHVSASLLKNLGYEGDLRVQQQHFKRFLKSNNVQLTELTTSDENIKKYPTITQEIEQMDNKGAASRRKWYIIEPREFKKVIMKLNTKNGDNIREYYLRLEELIKLYMEYVLYFNRRENELALKKSHQKIESLEKAMNDMMLKHHVRHLELLDNITDIKDQNKELIDQNEDNVQRIDTLIDQNEDLKEDVKIITSKLDISVEDRSPKLQRQSVRERFVLVKKNSGKEETYQYYALRGQKVYINSRLSKLKNERFPNLEIIVDILYQPNPRNLFLRFKEKIKGDKEWLTDGEDRFIYAGNNVGCPLEMQNKMINVLMTLDEEKREIF